MTITFAILLTILFINSSHPITIIAVILAQTLLICINMWFILNTSWFSYILFLIFLGGLIVLFVYTVRLASNEKFSIKIKRIVRVISPLILITVLYLININQQVEQTQAVRVKSFYRIYSIRIIRITISTILYLLLTLVVVVKITSKFKGPIRNILFKITKN